MNSMDEEIMYEILKNSKIPHTHFCHHLNYDRGDISKKSVWIELERDSIGLCKKCFRRLKKELEKKNG